MSTKEFNRYLRLIVSGDKRGMAALYNYYYEKIKLSAESEGISEANAHDVASKVLLDIFSHAESYGYIENPKAWMYRVIKNAIVNFKKQNAKYVYTEFMDEIYPAKDEKLDFKIDFSKFISKLPPRQQELVKLHYIFDFRIKEAAKIMGISVSTVNRDIALLKLELKKFKKYFE